ncbi:hypothetical protein SAMN05216276_100113 [Streptosporangium subroseum]|uniref:Uncharacterized protein n=1 Tax=Streptosporangium subroseum TaxID=106412 RepID=A0A238ZZE4_9ACTN|nr:hypothetical protein [Streptosporangium subroseum]SNR88522.1 hypothetical protein SAMN05216276_100113 [Streptosporangium subroseum]
MTENTNDAQKDQKATHAEPAQKAESTETAGGTQRSEPAERAESTDRAERAEPTERAERAEPTERPGRDERTERAERSGRDERAERSERTERPGRDERSEWAGRDERAGRTRSERTGSDRDPLSAATEEAFKLFETLQQKAARELRKNLIKGTMSGFGSAFSGGGRGKSQDVWEEAISEHDEYICRACPVCRAMAAQRESGGAVTDHLMQAGTELFAAFKSAVDGLNKPSSAQRARERGQEETPVEHIDLG